MLSLESTTSGSEAPNASVNQSSNTGESSLRYEPHHQQHIQIQHQQQQSAVQHQQSHHQIQHQLMQQHQNEAINHHILDGGSLHHIPSESNALHHQMPNHNIPVQNHHMMNTMNAYQHYIHTAQPTLAHIPLGVYDDHGKDDSSKKRRRTNYKDPENSNKLNAALNALINQQDGEGQKDLKTVSKLYNLPYNTLRDNFLKATTGQIQKSKRERKSTGGAMKPQDLLMHGNHNPSTLMQMHAIHQHHQNHQNHQLQMHSIPPMHMINLTSQQQQQILSGHQHQMQHQMHQHMYIPPHLAVPSGGVSSTSNQTGNTGALGNVPHNVPHHVVVPGQQLSNGSSVSNPNLPAPSSQQQQGLQQGVNKIQQHPHQMTADQHMHLQQQLQQQQHQQMLQQHLQQQMMQQPQHHQLMQHQQHPQHHTQQQQQHSQQGGIGQNEMMSRELVIQHQQQQQHNLSTMHNIHNILHNSTNNVNSNHNSQQQQQPQHQHQPQQQQHGQQSGMIHPHQLHAMQQQHQPLTQQQMHQQQQIFQQFAAHQMQQHQQQQQQSAQLQHPEQTSAYQRQEQQQQATEGERRESLDSAASPPSSSDLLLKIEAFGDKESAAGHSHNDEQLGSSSSSHQQSSSVSIKRESAPDEAEQLVAQLMVAQAQQRPVAEVATTHQPPRQENDENRLLEAELEKELLEVSPHKVLESFLAEQQHADSSPERNAAAVLSEDAEDSRDWLVSENAAAADTESSLRRDE